ncbi:MAG TPA: hypothetical protein VJV03_10670, partial [Pyrinomonadaceae bacterium]|nr:hypothetical protein [Pyrinomonadaceae bacterium]
MKTSAVVKLFVFIRVFRGSIFPLLLGGVRGGIGADLNFFDLEEVKLLSSTRTLTGSSQINKLDFAASPP